MSTPAPIGTEHPFHLIARSLRDEVSWASGSALDWDGILRCADQHGVAALLWSSLKGESGIPSAPLTSLSTFVASEVARAAIRERELGRVLASLESAGVDTIVIKGAALAYSCYPHPWLRTRTDTDLLLSRHSLEPAATTLEAAGYTQSANVSTGEFVSHQASWVRVDEHGLLHVMDVHWKVVNPQVLADVITFQDVRDSSVLVRAGAAALRVPHPVWSLLIACVHRLAHHQDQERLGWLFDIHLLARHLEPGDWDTLLQISTERRVSAICAAGLTTAARHLGTAVPTHTIRALTCAGSDDPSRGYAEQEQRRIDVLRDDLRHLARWQDRFRLLREHAFPSARFMMARYDTTHRAWLPACYIHRLVTGAWKWMRA